MSLLGVMIETDLMNLFVCSFVRSFVRLFVRLFVRISRRVSTFGLADGRPYPVSCEMKGFYVSESHL